MAVRVPEQGCSQMEELKLQFAREVAKEKRKLADIQARLEAAPDDNTRANLRNSAQVSRKRLTNLEGILAEVLTALAKSPPGGLRLVQLAVAQQLHPQHDAA
jgi:predicted  nucleic acid-binding Zn-ribbon protein